MYQFFFFTTFLVLFQFQFQITVFHKNVQKKSWKINLNIQKPNGQEAQGIEATGLIRNGIPQLNYYNKIIINRIIHAKINVSAIVNLNLVNANSVPYPFLFLFLSILPFLFLSFSWPARTQVQNWRINKRFSGQARVDNNSCCKCGWICLHSFYGKTL